MDTRARPLVENIAESTVACLITMVQGNLLALSLSHWWVASQTGVLAGSLTTAALLFARVEKPWLVSTLLGVATAAVDFFVHPGMFGPFFLEALATGLGAAGLSYAVQRGVIQCRGVRLRRREPSSDRSGSPAESRREPGPPPSMDERGADPPSRLQASEGSEASTTTPAAISPSICESE